MTTKASKQEIVDRLKRDLLQWHGLVKIPGKEGECRRLGVLDPFFPGGTFPVRAVHEFISEDREGSAATSGFIGGLLSRLMEKGKVCLWIGTHRAIFPPTMKMFQVDPGQLLFVEMRRPQDVLWAVEEALKCKGLGAVVGELQTMDFVQSRRLQLAVEESGVTALILRHRSRYPTAQIGTTASAVRWRIRPVPSESIVPGMPGVGFPRWEVEILKMRNGSPGRWEMEWRAGDFQVVQKKPTFQPLMDRHGKTRRASG